MFSTMGIFDKLRNSILCVAVSYINEALVDPWCILTLESETTEQIRGLMQD